MELLVKRAAVHITKDQKILTVIVDNGKIHCLYNIDSPLSSFGGEGKLGTG